MVYIIVFENFWVYDELFKSCNFGVVMYKFGIFIGVVFNFIDQNIFNGKLFVNLYDMILDYVCIQLAVNFLFISYLKFDGKFSFDKLSFVFLFNINYEED